MSYRWNISRINTIIFIIGTFSLISCSVETLSSSNKEYSAFSFLDDDNNDFFFNHLARKTMHSYKAIYQFGDSLSDTGNFKCENPYSTFATYPYGETYFHKPTGRCSDGLLIVDYLTKFFKLPFLDPYLNKQGNFTHGVNFAVTGATALDTSTLVAKKIIPTVTNHSLSVQLGWFKSHLGSICSNRGDCNTKLSKSLFILGEIGGNDYNFAIFEGKPMQELYDLVPQVIRTITNTVEELISLGASHIAIPGNFPVGCMTVYLATFKSNNSTMYDDLKCLKHLNTFAKFHNDQLRQEIRTLRLSHPGVTIRYMDYYKALKDVLRNAASLGFDQGVVHKTCCGNGDNDYNFDFGKSCGTNGVKACEDPYKRVNWDGYHLTGHAYNAMAKWLITHMFSGTSTVLE